MTAVRAMYETLKVLAPERAQETLKSMVTLSKVFGNDFAAFQDLNVDLHLHLDVFLENVVDLHKERIQYLLKKIYDSTAPEVYAEALLEHVQFLKKSKGGNNGS